MKIIFLLLLACTASLAAPSEVLTGFTLSNNQFTADIYKEHKVNADDNFVVCPFSVEILLALIHAGAGGTTADQLSRALRLPQKREVIDQIFSELHPKLQANEKYTLQSANKIYVHKDYSVKDQYKTTAVDVFGAAIQNIDFSQKKAAVADINGWVDQNTHHKINQLVSEQDITPETRAVLLNAIYFKGKWVTEFKKSETKKKRFYVTKKSYVNVDMMEQTNYFRYYQSYELKARFIELPYQGDNITMTIVLPDDKEGLPELENHIHEVVVEPAYRFQRVNLKMPKNKITTSIDLTDILQKIGIREAFAQTADFRQMLTVTDEPLYISKVVQKALIETDEEGTVAAAVTGGIMVTTLSLPMPPPIPINFHANHPFIFFLKHKDTGILFIGRYSTPEGQAVILENPAKDDEE